MTEIEQKGQEQSYGFQNFYYLDDMLTADEYNPDIPEYHHMMQHIYRNKISTGKLLVKNQKFKSDPNIFKSMNEALWDPQLFMSLQTIV